MRLSVEQNPQAMRVTSRSIALTLSVSPFDRPSVTLDAVVGRGDRDRRWYERGVVGGV